MGTMMMTREAATTVEMTRMSLKLPRMLFQAKSPPRPSRRCPLSMATMTLSTNHRLYRSPRHSPHSVDGSGQHRVASDYHAAGLLSVVWVAVRVRSLSSSTPLVRDFDGSSSGPENDDADEEEDEDENDSDDENSDKDALDSTNRTRSLADRSKEMADKVCRGESTHVPRARYSLMCVSL
jgi:hypothetical protein